MRGFASETHRATLWVFAMKGLMEIQVGIEYPGERLELPRLIV
jgi:hypothetical protein